MRTALICGYKDNKVVVDSFKIHGFSSLGSWTGFQYEAWFSSYCVRRSWVRLESCRLPPRLSDTTAPLGLLCYAGSQEAQLSRTVACLLPLEACMMPSGTTGASLHETFRSDAGQETLGPVKYIMSSRVGNLPSSLRGSQGQ